MKRRFAFVAIVLASIIPGLALAQVPSPAETSTIIAALEAEVKFLTQQLAALIAAHPTQTIPPNTTTPVSCAVSATLLYGSKGPDVVCLQQFLISQGLLAPGNTTGFYGPLTQSAVMNFQSSHSIVSSGSPASTGFGAVGPRTRTAILTLMTATPPVPTVPITPAATTIPTCAMYVMPSSITPGSSAMLNWTSTNASSTSLSNSLNAVAPIGSMYVNPTVATTYTGTFSSPGGSVTCSTTLNITPTIAPLPPAATTGLPGTLTTFYRSMQIQGPYIETGRSNVFLQQIPSYLTDPSLDYPYHTMNASGLEVPYASQIAIVRAVGGWTSQFVPVGQKPDSVDLIRFDTVSGQWITNYAQFTNGLKPFLDAGYKPQDITIVLDNAPWDLSTGSCSDGKPVMGTYGNRSIINNYSQWQSFIAGFAQAINTFTSGRAGDFRYRLGTEANSSVLSCGTLQDYEQQYAATAAGLLSVIPQPKLMPYEFSQTPSAGTGVFSTISLEQWIISNKLPNVGTGRSLNYFPYLKLRLPGSVATVGAQSFQTIHTANSLLAQQAPPEIDQFGTINPASTINAAFLDDGPSKASWNFQLMFRLIAQAPQVQVNHWFLLDTVPTSSGGSFLLPTASSWLYQVLDNLLGTSMTALTTKAVPAASTVQAYSVGFKASDRLTILASTYGMNVGQGPTQTVTITIPANLLPAGVSSLVIKTIPMAVQNTPSYLLRNMLQNNQIAGAGLSTPFLTSTTSIVGALNDMSADSNGGSASPTAVRKVGDLLAGSGAIHNAVLSQIRAMFTLQPYSSASLKKNADGSYTLTAGSFMPGDMKLFTIQ